MHRPRAVRLDGVIENCQGMKAFSERDLIEDLTRIDADFGHAGGPDRSL